MATSRDAILTGISRAAELHASLGLRSSLATGDKPVDVMRAVQQVGLFVLFKPLTSLLGAYVPSPEGAGMLVTTKRDLHVQRFTAAHELGHHVLKHRTLSLDKDVGFVARGEQSGHDYQELEADSFASEFLLPKWLLMAHIRRQKWSKSELGTPDSVYQLSLRLGASYSATCWALSSNDIVSKAIVSHLVSTAPKAAKMRVLPGLQPESWHRDVWLLSKNDGGTQVLGNPEDFLVLALEEHVSGGYVWDLDGMRSAGLMVERDDREDSGQRFGGPIHRRVVVHGSGHSRLHLEERRPWDQATEALNTFDLDLALTGKEEGLPRIARPTVPVQ